MESLLQNLKEILKDIEELKDENSNKEEFNAFQIFRLNDRELMHSRFIKSLLNPEEKHEFGSAFLEMFLKQVKISGFSTKGIIIECEKNTHNNRYIDIAIENKTQKQMIIIENKIWADDLDNQLSDYYQFGINLYKKHENIYIIYLTPYGRRPKENSFSKEINQPVNGITCISYENDIIDWLESCKKIIKNKNCRLYYCIEMYSELISKTINRDKYMEKILKQLVNNPKQMALAIDIVKAFQGRNFIEFGSESRKCIFENLNSTFENLEYNDTDGGDHYDETKKWESIEIEDNNKKKFDICFDNDSIYWKMENPERTTILSGLEIVCNDIDNKYLVALLTNNQKIIQEWIKLSIINLTGIAENLSE
jgi:hypothetical protein